MGAILSSIISLAAPVLSSVTLIYPVCQTFKFKKYHLTLLLVISILLQLASSSYSILNEFYENSLSCESLIESGENGVNVKQHCIIFKLIGYRPGKVFKSIIDNLNLAREAIYIHSITICFFILTFAVHTKNDSDGSAWYKRLNYKVVLCIVFFITMLLFFFLYAGDLDFILVGFSISAIVVTLISWVKTGLKLKLFYPPTRHWIETIFPAMWTFFSAIVSKIYLSKVVDKTTFLSGFQVFLSIFYCIWLSLEYVEDLNELENADSPSFFGNFRKRVYNFITRSKRKKEEIPLEDLDNV